MASGDKTPCFWCEPTKLAREELRRFTFSKDLNREVEEMICPIGYCHDARIIIAEQMPWTSEWEGSGFDDFPHSDSRWPKQCKCGYSFNQEPSKWAWNAQGKWKSDHSDQWQHHYSRLWQRQDTKAIFVLHEAPPGAMMSCDWSEPGPDGRNISVMCPGGTLWSIDGPICDKEGKRLPPWQRTGSPPNITATPSILTPQYHGFLTNGVLIEC